MNNSNAPAESFWDTKPHSYYRKHPRSRYRGHLWTKGRRRQCIARFAFCSVFIAFYLIFSIGLSLILWLRPPSIKISSAGISANSTGIDFTMTGITVTLSVDISVNNPNYISAKLNALNLEVIYPTEVARVPFGSGTLKDITFNTNSQTNFTFLFDIDYQYKDDPRRSALVDIANKCGILSSTKSRLSLEYKITAGVRVLSFTINPSISNTLSVACPIPDNVIQDIRQQIAFLV